MRKAIIHVNRQHIAMNSNDGGERPVYTIKRSPAAKALYAREVKINGPSRLVYSGLQLRCGARAWIECEFKDIEPVGGYVSFKEARNG
jgi:hypothetical protein